MKKLNYVTMDEFKKLNQKVKNALSSFGFKKPSPIQEQAIPKTLEGKNSLLIAPTGTGKTEAAILPVFSQYLEKRKVKEEKGIKIVYIAPLRALNRDMLHRLQKWEETLDIRIQVRHGDTSQYQRRKQALKPPDMLITTPETLQAILPGSRMKENLKSVRWVIVDEVHELVESKRGIQLSIALERLNRLSENFQRIGLSATVGNPKEVARFLCGNNREFEIINTSMDKRISINIESPMPDHKDAELSDKLNAQPTMISRLQRIRELIKKNESTLTFVNTREASETLGSRLKFWNPDFPVGVHHGSLSKEARISTEEKFRNGDLKGLISTSSMELGIDIGDIDFIIQYSSPRQVTRLVQRIGRSGHKIGATSNGTIITTDPEDAIESGVIAKRTLKSNIESAEMFESSFDVLAHQIVGINLDGVSEIKEIYKIVKKAYPYRKLSKDDFISVIQQLLDQRIIWRNENEISRGKRSWKYYYTNLSMIPDTKQYKIKSLVSGESIGTLDEEFVVGEAKPGVTFICRGEAWRVLEIEEDEIKVEPINDPYGAIPAWEGELIPVPFEVAKEVSYVRNHVANSLENGKSEKEIAKKLRKDYLLDENASEWAIRFIKDHLGNIPIPTDKRLVIESYEKFCVLHAPFGTKVNKTLGQILGALISTRLGTSIGVRSDPYRIAFRLPKKEDTEAVEKTLPELESKYVDPLINKIMENSSVFRWRLLHVAKRFGAVDKKADFSEISWYNIADSFRNTPIWKEAEREVRLEKMDIPKLKRIPNLIDKKEIEIKTVKRGKKQGPTQMGLSILNELASTGELVVPERAEREILEVLKRRLHNKQVKIYCMNCRNWSSLTRVRRLSDEPTCKNCDARYLTLVPTRKSGVLKMLNKEKEGLELTKKEKKEIKRVRDAGNLILTYGKKAIVALAGRGVGPTTAKRILRKQYKNERDFYKAILDAERLYARTHRFWDS